MMDSLTSARQQLSAANPYVNRDYRKSGIQSFLQALGFRTGADAWSENMATQAAEYDAQMALKQYDEEYNLPINQVARLRAAGINPDLNGGQGVDPGSAANVADDPSTPMQSTGDEGKLMNFLQGIVSCVSMAAGISGTIENVRGIRLDNFLKSITGEQEMSEYASKIFPFLIPQNPNDVFDSDGNFSDNALSGFVKRAEVFAGQLPKHLQDKFKKQVNAFWSSAPGTAEAYKQWHDNMMSQKGYAIDSRTNFSWDSGEMSVIASGLAELASKVEKEGFRSKGNEAKYNADYYEHLNGELAAGAENSENKMNKENFDMVGTLRESLSSMIKELKGRSDKFEKEHRKGINTSSVLLTALSMLQLYMATQGSPSARRSSTSGIDAKTGREYSNRTTIIDF